MTSIWFVIGWLVSTAAVTVVTVFAILFFAYRARVPGFAAQARSARFVASYDDALQWLGVRYRERQRLTNELRANIAAAAADAPVREVLDRMGSAKELARGVAARRRGPTWIMGAAAAMIAFVAQVAVTLLMQATFLSTVQELAGPYESVTVRVPLGLLFEGTLGDDGGVLSMAVTTSLWLVAIPLVAFILWSRPWRLFTAGAARRASGDTVSP